MSASTDTRVHLDRPHSLKLLRLMMLIRRFEERCS